MGYFGLQHYEESDRANGVAIDMMKAVAKVLRQALKEESNEFNTSGPENVAMIFEALICPVSVQNNWAANYEIVNLANKTIKALNRKIKDSEKDDWSDVGNKRMHLNAYRRMLKSMKKFVEYAESV